MASTVPPSGAIHEVEHDSGRLQSLEFTGRSAAAKERFHASEELRQVEGFREVIIGPTAQAVHLVFGRTLRAEHDHRRFYVRGSDLLDHAQAILAREH